MPREIENRLNRRPDPDQTASARGEIVRNFGSFTRGSQLVRLRYMMLLEGLRWPAHLRALTAGKGEPYRRLPSAWPDNDHHRRSN